MTNSNKISHSNVLLHSVSGSGLLYSIGNILAGIWILGGTLFFLIRLSAVFYSANKDAIDNVLDRLSK